MRRGTTPGIYISTDIDLTGAENLYVTFQQLDTVVFEKTLDDCTIEKDHIVVILTQDDTLSLNHKYKVYVQIRGTLDNAKIASNIMMTSVEKILKDGKI